MFIQKSKFQVLLLPLLHRQALVPCLLLQHTYPLDPCLHSIHFFQHPSQVSIIQLESLTPRKRTKPETKKSNSYKKRSHNVRSDKQKEASRKYRAKKKEMMQQMSKKIDELQKVKFPLEVFHILGCRRSCSTKQTTCRYFA